jgi:hypothetical protein
LKAHYLNKNNHPMYGKSHTSECPKGTKLLISKPGSLNPMFGKNHNLEAKIKISNRLSSPVTLYNNKNQYILTFKK